MKYVILLLPLVLVSFLRGMENSQRQMHQNNDKRQAIEDPTEIERYYRRIRVIRVGLESSRSESFRSFLSRPLDTDHSRDQSLDNNQG